MQFWFNLTRYLRHGGPNKEKSPVNRDSSCKTQKKEHEWWCNDSRCKSEPLWRRADECFVACQTSLRPSTIIPHKQKHRPRLLLFRTDAQTYEPYTHALSHTHTHFTHRCRKLSSKTRPKTRPKGDWGFLLNLEDAVATRLILPSRRPKRKMTCMCVNVYCECVFMCVLWMYVYRECIVYCECIMSVLCDCVKKKMKCAGDDANITVSQRVWKEWCRGADW